MTGDELADIHRRLRRLEDEAAVLRLLATYGPLVDAGEADAAAGLWRADGQYDVDGRHMRDRDEIRDMIGSDAHRGLISAGSAHFQGPARVSIQGDRAVAVFESLLVHRREGGYRVLRATVHRVELRREEDGWRIARRVGRLLDGGEQARALLASAAEE